MQAAFLMLPWKALPVPFFFYLFPIFHVLNLLSQSPARPLGGLSQRNLTYCYHFEPQARGIYQPWVSEELGYVTLILFAYVAAQLEKRNVNSRNIRAAREIPHCALIMLRRMHMLLYRTDFRRERLQCLCDKCATAIAAVPAAGF